ncbi:MAG: hypothetical protein ABIK43_06520 [candidate division WOR-3 bacterium]
MRRSLVIALTLLLARISFSRESGGGIGMFGPSLGFIDYSGLNSTLRRYGFEQLASPHPMMGGAGYGFINRIVIGGGGWGGSQTVASESLNLRCQVSVSGGEFQVGYSVVFTRRFVLTPLLGIGGTGYEISLQPATGSVTNLDSLLAHPGRTSALSFSSLSTSLQLGLTLPVSFVALHMRGGYYLMPGSPAWTTGDGSTVIRGPSVAKGMPFASLCIGFGGFGKDN